MPLQNVAKLSAIRYAMGNVIFEFFYSVQGKQLRNIPQTNSMIIATTSQKLTIRAKGNRVDPTGVAS